MRFRIPIFLLVSFLVSFLVTACSSGGVRPTVEERIAAMGLTTGEGDQRIPHYQINGWSALDDQNLILTAGVNDRYLVKLQTSCMNLDGAFFLGFTTPTGSLDKFEDIVVQRAGYGREYCAIQDIIRLQSTP